MRSVGYQAAEPLRVWVVTDGRAGIENQALGLAEALARRTPVRVQTKRVRLRTPWTWMPASFVPLPRQALSVGSDAIEPPWPDLLIGCGRASIPFSLGVKSWSDGATFVVQLQDPRVNPREFDMVVPPIHDELEGPNVVPIVGACHRVTPERLDQEVMDFVPPLEELAPPRFAVLIGGKSKRQDIGAERARSIADSLAAVQRETGGTLMVTLSRRTGDAARMQFRTWLAPHSAIFFEGEGPNPYFAMLGAADHIFVTVDSVSMATEAAATAKPIHLLAVDGSAGKLDRFHQSLMRRGCARPFNGRLENWSYPPLLETDRVAAAVLSAWTARIGR
ncbi:MAG: mitochondrial fission ELM1 family protein [Sphingopyxis sp.]|uniref:mitochondrial fission ELM1 family protein n=1 Tax=Sphingopyxis sp. TaxID=1908224 RepID=UPI001A44E9B6|nr:mitochondrial fission ELM1 family protein [Sphingopyxis sp.]MBL9065709.1 mitochondrial fission ELM1 family protein [Sphingopyxis sp.]